MALDFEGHQGKVLCFNLGSWQVSILCQAAGFYHWLLAGVAKSKASALASVSRVGFLLWIYLQLNGCFYSGKKIFICRQDGHCQPWKAVMMEAKMGKGFVWL